MSPLAQKALELAEQSLGVREHPPGSNRGPEVDEYLRFVGLDPAKRKYPWCSAFTCTMIGRAASALRVPTKVRYSAMCRVMVERNQSLLIERPEIGCLFVHLNPDGTGHIGFVVFAHDDLTIETIEGNTDGKGSRTGGCVMRQTRPPDYAQAFIRIT